MDNRKLTIDDIARELHISKTTVSRAISGKGRIGQETRDKVLKYIKENNYRPSAIAKGLAQSKTFNISFVMPGDYSIVDLPFYQGLLYGISSVASKSDYDVIVSMVTENDISQLVRLIDNHKVDGVILGRTLEVDKAQEYLKQKEVPFVTAGSSRDKDTIQVDNDHRSACKEITMGVFRRGIRKIALVGGNMKYIVNQNRLAGFLDACAKENFSLDEEFMHLNLDNERDVEDVVEKLIDRKVECIICMDDYICGCVLGKLGRESMRVPEGIKVVSFYNSILLENSQSVMTTLQFNVPELAAACCNTLLAHIDKQKVPEKTLLGYEVIIREVSQK